jgi:hypothetical protein
MEKIPNLDRREEKDIALSLKQLKDQLSIEISRLKKEGGDRNWTKEQKEIIKRLNSAVRNFTEVLTKSKSENRREVLGQFMTRGNTLKERLESLSLKPDEYRLYHVLAGSSPHPSVEIKYFDTDDKIIQNFLTTELFMGLYERLGVNDGDDGDEDGDGDGEGMAA